MSRFDRHIFVSDKDYSNCLFRSSDGIICHLNKSNLIHIEKKESEMADKFKDIPPTLPAQEQIDLLLKDRGSKYGSFDLHAKLTQGMFDIFLAHMQNYNPEGYKKLTDSMRESLHMVFHKLGRIGNGDPEYADSWVDGAGYFKLQANILQSNEKFNGSK